MARPTLWMAPLILVILAGAFGAPWGSVATVDERTYLEMTLGIRESGLPSVSNGPVDRFPPLQARWNYHRDGQMWGVMAPGFPYLTAAFIDALGIRGAIRLNLVLLALLALAVYGIGRELTDRQDIGVGAAYVLLLTIPVWTSSLAFLPYSLAITGFAGAMWCASRALTRERTGWALLAGLLAGLATMTQLLVFPLLFGLVVALAWHRRRLGLAAAIGALPPMSAMAWINWRRFGSWNPLSDGPCVWQGCPETGVDPQSVGHMLLAATPTLAWLLVSALLVGSQWRHSRRSAVAIAAGIALLPLVLLEPLREGVARYVHMGWRLLVDVGVWEPAQNTMAAGDGLGTFIGPHVVKALLQGSPALILAAFARLERPRLRLLWLPVASLFAMLLLRGVMPVDFALGHPFLNLRYLMPAAPALAVLTVVGAARLPWALHHLALAAFLAAVLRWLLGSGSDDAELWRRVLLLRISLVLVLLLGLTASRALRVSSPILLRAATILAAVAFGWGAGVSLGVDLAATMRLRDRVEILVSELNGRLPERCALVGHPDQLDAPLTLMVDRDLEYLDLQEVDDRSQVTDIVGWWLAEDRPVYWLLPPDQESDPGGVGGLGLEIVEPSLGLARVTGIAAFTHRTETAPRADPRRP